MELFGRHVLRVLVNISIKMNVDNPCKQVQFKLGLNEVRRLFCGRALLVSTPIQHGLALQVCIVLRGTHAASE